MKKLVFTVVVMICFGSTSLYASNYSKGSFRIQITKQKRVRVQHDFRLFAPHFQATEWIAHVSQAPSYLAQQRTTTVAHLLGKQGLFRLSSDHESSALRRPIQSIRFTREQLSSSNSFHIQSVYESTLQRRELIRGSHTGKICRLTDREQKWYLTNTKSLDFTTKEMSAWIKNAELIRKPGENELGFAYRVLVYMKQHFHWIDVREFDPGNQASKVCAAMRGDCAKLSLVYSSILRANHIPTRILGIRWTPSGTGHIMTEFYVPSVGWVPVDVLVDKKDENHFATVGKSSGFGSTTGEYFVHYIDDGYKLTTFDGMAEIYGLHSVAWYAKGYGSFHAYPVSTGLSDSTGFACARAPS